MSEPPWRARLPGLQATIDRCVRQWRLRPEPPFPGRSYNYAAPVRLPGGEAAVLKICPRDEPEFLTELESLRLYDGAGAVRLLDADEAAGAMLLERAVPGTALPDGPGAEAVVAQVMARLHRPVAGPHRFPTVADWGRRAFSGHRARYGGPGPLPAALLGSAERTLAEPPAVPRLLHGDLHHTNILASRRAGWLAVDPKGVVGEPAFDTYAFLHNPVGVAITAAAQRRRADALADALGLDRAHVRRWAVAGIMLSIVWTLEARDVPEAAWRTDLACAEALA
jgi:streptomycin 6-kinase